MRVSRHRHKRQMSEINVVPYIDVMLVLLVIFMVTAPLMMEGVTIDLPTADAKPVADDRPDATKAGKLLPSISVRETGKESDI